LSIRYNPATRFRVFSSRRCRGGYAAPCLRSRLRGPTMVRVKSLLSAGLLAALAAGMILVPTSSRAADIGYVEDFALAKDRAVALKQLIPGTEDYYYYHALHALNSGQYDAVEGHIR